MQTRNVLAQNLRALMEAKPELATLVRITAASGGRLSNGKLDRIRRATHATDVDTLGDLAEVFGLEPWQLLVRGLNPDALPALAGPELLDQIRALLVGKSPSTASAGTPENHKPRPSGRVYPDSSTDEAKRRLLQRDSEAGIGNEAGAVGRLPRKRGNRRA